MSFGETVRFFGEYFPVCATRTLLPSEEWALKERYNNHNNKNSQTRTPFARFYSCGFFAGRNI